MYRGLTIFYILYRYASRVYQNTRSHPPASLPPPTTRSVRARARTICMKLESEFSCCEIGVVWPSFGSLSLSLSTSLCTYITLSYKIIGCDAQSSRHTEAKILINSPVSFPRDKFKKQKALAPNCLFFCISHAAFFACAMYEFFRPPTRIFHCIFDYTVTIEPFNWLRHWPAFFAACHFAA